MLLGGGDRSFDWESDERLTGAEVHRLREAGPEALAFMPGLLKMLPNAHLDLLHLHGIWQYPSFAAAVWAKQSGQPLLISPHGMVDPWITGRNRWKKALAETAWERRCWSRAAAFHALTGAEANDIQCHTGKTNIAIIPNAAPPVPAAPVQNRSPTLLYLSRIHPKKNLSALLDGWTAARPLLPPQANLVIAGWGAERDRSVIEQRCAAAPATKFVGPIFGAAKERLLASARFLILPSFSEGLPMVVLEAWAHGTPTLMSTACHLPQGFAAGVAIDCGTNAQSIARAIIVGFALPEQEWHRMAAAGRQLSAGQFGRSTVAQAWEHTYASLLDTRA